LGAILTLAATREGLGSGMALLGTYALGLAVPFLITALALDRFLAWFQRFRPYLVWVDRAAGALLIVLGLLLVPDRFTLLAGSRRIVGRVAGRARPACHAAGDAADAAAAHPAPSHTEAGRPRRAGAARGHACRHGGDRHHYLADRQAGRSLHRAGRGRREERRRPCRDSGGCRGARDDRGCETGAET